MQHIMLDLETMGTNNNALVTTISAVQFDLATGEMGSEFECALDWKEQIDKGAIMDVDTVKWWLSQSKDAQNTMLRLRPKSVRRVLTFFNEWLCGIVDNPIDVKLWGNGSVFDNVILRNLYTRSHIDFILPFWCDNDVRTLVTLGNVDIKQIPFEGVKHRGLDDCKHQIKYCHLCKLSLAEG